MWSRMCQNAVREFLNANRDVTDCCNSGSVVGESRSRTTDCLEKTQRNFLDVARPRSDARPRGFQASGPEAEQRNIIDNKQKHVATVKHETCTFYSQLLLFKH